MKNDHHVGRGLKGALFKTKGKKITNAKYYYIQFHWQAANMIADNVERNIVVVLL